MGGILMEEFCESRPKITQICQISIKIQVPHNEFQRDMFENHDIKNQILGTCGSYEPLNSPKINYAISIPKYLLMKSTIPYKICERLLFQQLLHQILYKTAH